MQTAYAVFDAFTGEHDRTDPVASVYKPAGKGKHYLARDTAAEVKLAVVSVDVAGVADICIDGLARGTAIRKGENVMTVEVHVPVVELKARACHMYRYAPAHATSLEGKCANAHNPSINGIGPLRYCIFWLM